MSAAKDLNVGESPASDTGDFRSFIDFRARLPAPELGDPLTRSGKMAAYETLYQMQNDDRQDAAREGVIGFLAKVKALGARTVVWPAADNRSNGGSYVPDELIARYQQEYPDQIRGLAGFDPHAGMVAIKSLEQSLTDLGLSGVSVAPFMHEIYASDPRYWPMYDLCQDIGVPVVVHSSVNFATGVTQDFGHPSHLDAIAVQFPELKLVAGHGGWPWVLELISVAWRHEHVFVELSGIRPIYLSKPGTGWEPILAYGESLLRDRILFGTNWPSLPPRRTVKEFEALPISDAAKQAWMHDNAAALLGL